MSLCRYLPAPSDRMAILWSLLAIKDAVVLEYGPAGTTHYSMILYGKLDVEQESKLFTTHMSEDDVVMGDVSRLEKAILEVDRFSNAKVIFVVASSISAIIGTDIKGVCNAMQDEVSAKLVCFDQGGLKGDYSVGNAESYKLICKEIAKKNVEKQEKTFNVIGLSLGQYRAQSDLWEIEELMREAFGYTIGTALCANTTVEKLENLGSAEINLCINDEGIGACKSLEKKCKTPYVTGCPYGYKGTLEWLEKVSKAIDKQINPEMLERLQTRIKELQMGAMRIRMMRDEAPVATVIADYARLVGIASLLKEFNFDIDALVCDHSLSYVQDKDPQVKYLPIEKDRLNIIESCKNQLILGDDISLELADDSNTKVLVSAPFLKGTVAKHMPIIGEKGADYLSEYISTYINKAIRIRR